tara:strand:- start:63 stop:296 length:234 start_codon:yes stop_codon:yes gene_type:complete
MPNNPVAIFMAASTILAASSLDISKVNAEEDLGGLKEWTTDQSVDDEYKLDSAAKKLKEKAKKSNTCIPIGEGENCW